MKPVFISALMLVCIAFGAALVPIAERLDILFHHTPSEAGQGNLVPALAFMSCLDLQRELNRLNPELKLVEDGICGPATMAAWNEVVFNGYALELWPE